MAAIAGEDSAALDDVALAGAGLLVHELGGPAASDAVASLLIGLVLAASAVGLGRPLACLLIRNSIALTRLATAYTILADAPGIDEVLSVYVFTPPRRKRFSLPTSTRPRTVGRRPRSAAHRRCLGASRDAATQ